VHVNRGVTTHGFAVNVSNDLQPFEWVVPCGIEDCRMTSVCRELGTRHQTGCADAHPRIMDDYTEIVAGRFAEIYGREPIPVEPDALAELLGEPAPIR
jgi:lipoyl(octanoyl) transferase